jgi:hypothetical protein
MDAVRNVFDNFNYESSIRSVIFERLATHALQQTRLFPQTVKNSRVRVDFLLGCGAKRKGGCCSRPLLIFELEWG